MVPPWFVSASRPKPSAVISDQQRVTDATGMIYSTRCRWAPKAHQPAPVIQPCSSGVSFGQSDRRPSQPAVALWAIRFRRTLSVNACSILDGGKHTTARDGCQSEYLG